MKTFSYWAILDRWNLKTCIKRSETFQTTIAVKPNRADVCDGSRLNEINCRHRFAENLQTIVIDY